MASCRHHSGYLADDEAGHSTYVARVQPPKKSMLPEMGSASKLGRMPHPPSMDGNSAYRGHRQTAKGPQAFGSFLDFLTEGQVLDSLQTVVEEATERMASMKTEAGVPLVEVQDPIEVPSGRRQTRVRPSFSTVHRHRAQPSLCTGPPNNYPSCSSSMSDSHSSVTAGCLGSHSWNSDLGTQGLGSLPPMRDNKLLLEKNLKRLLRLEKKGSPSVKLTKKKPLPSISSKSSMSHLSNPWYEELINFLVDQAVSLLICKYKFENNLNKQLGFISFPVTETLMDLFLGFKKVKGSHIRLSSKIDWNCLLQKLEEDHLVQQASRQASRLGAHHPSSTSQLGASQVSASHHRVPHLGSSRHNIVPLSPQPIMQTESVADENQAQAEAQDMEPAPSLNTELPIQQLPSTQEPTTEEEKIPISLSEPKLSLSSTTSLGFSPSKSKEMVNIEDTYSSGKAKVKSSDKDKDKVKASDEDKAGDEGSNEDKYEDEGSDEDKYEDKGSDEDKYEDEGSDEDKYEDEGSDEDKYEDEGSDEDKYEYEVSDEDEYEDEGSYEDKDEDEHYSTYKSESQSFPKPGLETTINYSVDMGRSDPP